jgi:tRNA(Ile)-lysidine synthase
VTPVETLERKSLDTIERYRMLDRGDRVVVSVSGGQDSVALLLMLHSLGEAWKLELFVFHLDHMFRGDESAADARFVADLVEGLGLPSRIAAVDVPSMLVGTGSSPQDLARSVRMELLAGYADEVGARRVATGHTADDQVETFLMRVVQGAGLTGLCAIPPVNGRTIRPLIDVWRDEAAAYCRALGVETRLDSSNERGVYLRNRIRLNLIPNMSAEFGAGVKDVILREIQALSIDREYIDAEARKAFDEVARVGKAEVRIVIEALEELPRALAGRVVRQAWNRLFPERTGLSWRHVADIFEKVARGSTGAAIDLPGLAVAEREYGELVLRAGGRADERASGGHEVELRVPGSVRPPWSPFRISAAEVRAAGHPFDPDPAVELIRSDVTIPLTVRAPLPGDRFHPLGSPGSRKLSDFFTDIKLPRRLRACCPLVLSAGEIVWVAGQRLDGRFRLEPGAARAIELRIGSSDEYDER